MMILEPNLMANWQPIHMILSSILFLLMGQHDQTHKIKLTKNSQNFRALTFLMMS